MLHKPPPGLKASGVAAEGGSVSRKDEDGAQAPAGKPPYRGYDERPIPDALLAIFLATLATALVLGYLFLNKMVAISQQDDCILGHRGNCAATQSPSSR
jgi:hypothetical protein